MKAFYRVFAVVLVLIAIIFLLTNIVLSHINAPEGRPYRVDAARAAAVIEESGLSNLNLEDYKSLRGVYLVTSREDLQGEDSDYLVRIINGQLYRFDYTASTDTGHTVTIVNLSLAVMALTIIVVLLYVYTNILKPFDRLENMPYELSKGNLTVPLHENRQRFFGKFTWGMDILRVRLEEQKKSELALQAEKKKLILSISHDIKIPLSAIKLYAKALEKRLYGEEKQVEIAEKINEKADEISGFVSKIVRASNEDFLALEINNGEFYFSELIKQVQNHYAEKFALLNIVFRIDQADDCLLWGDIDRAVEVIQNIVENAVKYGDGVAIYLRFSDEENCRLIMVENSGCSITADELPHIFDSFWRGPNASNVEGSGLGLYICRTLMNRMDGEIFAECIADNNMRVTAVFRKV